MPTKPFALAADDGTEIHGYRWEPDREPRAVVQIVHGLADHGGRYAELAESLTRAGYAVYAGDLRGHGRTLVEGADLGFFAEKDGWRKCLDDLWLLNRRIAKDHPGAPIILLGHSMGSFLTQHFMSEHGEALIGAFLSSSDGPPPVLARVGRLIARFERWRLGSRGRSQLIHALAFGRFNRHFEPARTPFDWLSRDPAEVDRYANDPFCGFIATTQLWVDLLDGWAQAARPEQQARIPKDLAVQITAGMEDPVSKGTKGLARLMAAYRRAGLKRVTYSFYPGARHELFHETNRAAVTRDLMEWLDEL